jgi:2-phospho-L-lactate guanylyltransferase
VIKSTLVATIIPAKPFTESKQRLSPVLSHRERISLSKNLLQHTILAAMPIGPVAVVSRCAAVRNFAAEIGTQTLVEKQANLNAAIRQGITWAKTQGCSGVLILPLDLPLLSTAVIKGLLDVGLQHSPSIVIAPCRHSKGTNALLLNPPSLIQPHFGPASFDTQQKLAQKVDISPKIYNAPELAFDLDIPEDWRDLASTDLLSNRNLFASHTV